MMNSGNSDRNKGQRLGLFIFECVMSPVYVFLSILLLFTTYFNRSVPQELRIGVGIAIGLYGLFRVYRAYVKIKEKIE